MNKIQNFKQYDLEDRTYRFAKDCRDFAKRLPNTVANFEYKKQLVRSSGSQAANYIEANEAVSRKDFLHRIKISRKESKESRLWLKLSEVGKDEELKDDQKNLIQEATELVKIFSSILESSKKR